MYVDGTGHGQDRRLRKGKYFHCVFILQGPLALHVFFFSHGIQIRTNNRKVFEKPVSLNIKENAVNSSQPTVKPSSTPPVAILGTKSVPQLRKN